MKICNIQQPSIKPHPFPLTMASCQSFVFCVFIVVVFVVVLVLFGFVVPPGNDL